MFHAITTCHRLTVEPRILRDSSSSLLAQRPRWQDDASRLPAFYTATTIIIMSRTHKVRTVVVVALEKVLFSPAARAS